MSFYTKQDIPTASNLEHPVIRIQSPPITKRGVTEDTLVRYGIVNPGMQSTIATPIYKYEQLIGWKYRKGGWVNSSEKETWWAPGSKRWLIGTQLWSGDRCVVYLCEGETDMLALSQAIPPSDLALCYGGAPELRELPEWLGWLDKAASEIRLCFDNDAAGDTYRQQFEENWSGTTPVKSLVLPPNTKDVAELLMVGGELHWVEFPELPATILTTQQVEAKLYQVYEPALTTGCPALDNLVDGYKDGKIIILAGMEKQGKSQYMAWLTCQFIAQHQSAVMFFSLELTPQETLARLRAVDPQVDNVYFVDHFGYIAPDVLAKHLRVCKRLGVKLVVIDHLTAAATQFGNEGLTTQALDGLLYQLQALANELSLFVLAVTHVNSSCQGVITTQHLRGSRALAQVPDVVLSIQVLDGGLSEVRTVTRDRVAGKLGRICYKYIEGSYEAIETKEIL
jgi:hypothetical protein